MKVCRLSAVAVLALLALAGISRADLVVAAGYDVLESGPGTELNGVAFQGVPLGSFNFDTVGVQSTGNADTIIQRTTATSITGTSGTASATPIKVVALQLMSSTQVFVDGGMHTEYITLSTAQPSTGSETITFNNANGGTFTSFFDVFVDIHIDSINGTVVQSDVELQLTNDTPTPWSRTPPAGAVTIPGANTNLDGSDNSQDFWFSNFSDMLQTAPEPASLSLLCIGGLSLLGYARRRNKAAR